MAIAAKIPMIATTIINSMRVKPSCFRNCLKHLTASLLMVH